MFCLVFQLSQVELEFGCSIKSSVCFSKIFHCAQLSRERIVRLFRMKCFGEKETSKFLRIQTTLTFNFGQSALTSQVLSRVAGCPRVWDPVSIRRSKGPIDVLESRIIREVGQGGGIVTRRGLRASGAMVGSYIVADNEAVAIRRESRTRTISHSLRTQRKK